MSLYMKSYCLLLLCSVLSCFVYAQPHVTDSLLLFAENAANDTVRIKSLRDLGFLYTKTSSPKAKAYFRQAISLGEQIHETVYTASTYVQLCMLYANEGEPDSALYFLRHAKQLAETEKENPRLWAGYYQGEGIYYKHKGDYQSALSSYFQGLKFLKESGDATAEAGCYINIGNIYKAVGSLNKSIEYELKALKLFEQLKNNRGIAYCYQNIGNIFSVLKQYKDALKYLQLAVPLKVELGDKKGMASALKGMSLATAGMGKYSEALGYARKSLAMHKELKLKSEMADGYLLISKIYHAIGNPALAWKNIQAADSLASKVGDDALSARIATEKMELDTLTHKDTDALPTLGNLHQKLDKAYASGDSNRIANNYQSLSAYYARQQDFKNAYLYLNKYNTLQGNMTGKDIQLQIKELETRYRVEKKEKQILLLQKNKELNIVLMQKQKFLLIGALLLAVLIAAIGFLLINRFRIIQRSRRLVEMEKMRNNIARDLHDDIGSALSSIRVMGSVALKRNINDPSVNTYLRKIVDHSGKITENMRDIVWAINPNNDTLEKMIIYMKEFAGELLEPLDIVYHFINDDRQEDIILSLNDRRDLFMIYKEALNNAAKYSECDEVEITFQTHAGYLYLTISDNGKGFDMKKNTCGNGLVNMRIRAARMGGVLEVDAAVGKGVQTRLAVALP